MKRVMVWVLLLEGLSSAGIQMLSIRQSVGHTGASVLTASVVIAAFLLALACGYAAGGRKTANHRTILIRNLAWSIAILGLAFSYPAVDFFYTTLDHATRSLGPVLNNPLTHLGLFSLVIMGPLVFLLAQTVPLALHESRAETKSQAAGDGIALSTVGNVAGCLITTLVLLYYFGTGAAVFINASLLAVCLFILVSHDAQRHKIPAISAILVLAVSFEINVSLGHELFKSSNAYADTRVIDHDDGRMMIINRSAASFVGNQDKRGFEYIELAKKALFSAGTVNKKYLVLGAGGFTLTASADIPADIDVTFVDVDPDLRAVAEEHFLKQPIKGRFVVSDARAFLLRTEDRYDGILLDVFSNASTIPQHLTTKEFYALLSSRLTKNGLAVLNVIADPTLSDSYSLHMDHTIRSSLSRCMTDIIQPYARQEANLLYFCRQPRGDGVLSQYVDGSVRVGLESYLASMGQRNKGQKAE